MTEVTLTNKQLEELAEIARRHFVHDTVNKYAGNNFLAMCYLKAILEFTSRNKLIIDNGKVLKRDSSSG